MHKKIQKTLLMVSGLLLSAVVTAQSDHRVLSETARSDAINLLICNQAIDEVIVTKNKVMLDIVKTFTPKLPLAFRDKESEEMHTSYFYFSFLEFMHIHKIETGDGQLLFLYTHQDKHPEIADALFKQAKEKYALFVKRVGLTPKSQRVALVKQQLGKCLAIAATLPSREELNKQEGFVKKFLEE